MVQPRSRRLSLPKPVLLWSGCSLGMSKERGEVFGGLSTLSLVSVIELEWRVTGSLFSLFFRRVILTQNLIPMFKCNSSLLLGCLVGAGPLEGNHPSLRT